MIERKHNNKKYNEEPQAMKSDPREKYVIKIKFSIGTLFIYFYVIYLTPGNNITTIQIYIFIYNL